MIVDTRMGWQIYVVGVGRNIFKGTFRLKVWIEKVSGQAVENKPEVKEDEKEIEDKNTTSNLTDCASQTNSSQP